MLTRDVLAGGDDRLGHALDRSVSQGLLSQHGEQALLKPLARLDDGGNRLIVVLLEAYLALQALLLAPLGRHAGRILNFVRLVTELLIQCRVAVEFLLFETLKRLLTLGIIDFRDDELGKIENLLQFTRRDIQQQRQPAGCSFEVPDMANRRRQLDVPHALTPHLRAGHLNAAFVADDALVANALVLAAIALPILRGSEDAFAEQTILLWFEGAIIDRLGLGYLAVRPTLDLLRRSETDSNSIEIVDFQHDPPISD